MTDQASSETRQDASGAKHSGNRYGRSEQARRAVLAAVDDLLVEVGFAALTIEGIATRAGVAKQTIYRWWPSKVDILLDALGDDLAEHLTPAEHGDLEQELTAHLAAVAEFLAESDAGAMLRALTGVALHDSAIAERLRTEHLARQRERDRLPLRRAVSRGELPAELDLDRAIDQLLGPIYYRVLVTGQPVPRAFTEELVREFLARHRGRG